MQDFCNNNDTSQLTEELSEKFIQTKKTTMSQIGTGTIKEFIESFDKIQDSFAENGVIYRYKYTGPRDYVTILGAYPFIRTVIVRRMTQLKDWLVNMFQKFPKKKPQHLNRILKMKLFSFLWMKFKGFGARLFFFILLHVPIVPQRQLPM